MITKNDLLNAYEIYLSKNDELFVLMDDSDVAYKFSKETINWEKIPRPIRPRMESASLVLRWESTDVLWQCKDLTKSLLKEADALIILLKSIQT